MQRTNEAQKLETIVTADKGKNTKKLLAALGIAVVLILALVISVIAASGTSGKKLQAQLDLGNKYLDEMDYEQARVAFNTALEIDPKNADAYEGLIKLYAAEQDAQGIADTYLQAAEYLTGEELDRVQKNAAEQLEALVKAALSAGEYDRAEDYANLLAQVDTARAENLRTQIVQTKAEAERLAREQAERLAQEQAQVALANASVGEYVTFGHYEQDNNTANGAEPIEWQVLAKEEGRTLLISRYALDAQPYNEEDTDVTWETCTLRNWMNNSFYGTAFDASEREHILEVMNDNPDSYAFYSSEYVREHYGDYFDERDGTNGGNVTADHVFLLSYAEALDYFTSDEDRGCVSTTYANAQGAWFGTDASTGECTWWLRSPSHYQSGALVVLYGGVVDKNVFTVGGSFVAVRPALWIAQNISNANE